MRQKAGPQELTANKAIENIRRATRTPCAPPHFPFFEYGKNVQVAMSSRCIELTG